MHVINYSRDQELGSGYEWLAGLVSRVCMAGLVFRVCMGVQIFRGSKYYMIVQLLRSINMVSSHISYLVDVCTSVK